jgi:hypothetical protein
MTARHFRAAFALVLMATIAQACTSGGVPADDAGYVQELLAARAAKDAEFRNSGEPIPRDRFDEFLPLSYFPPDPEYMVPASFTPATETIVAEMPTSTGTIRRTARLGVLQFTLKGQQLSLAAFSEEDMNRLFVPFSDLTSGTETYPAGRYIDLTRTPTGIYILDFNRAYHPYCYYNVTYECPYPPAENRLPLPVRAGERLPASKAQASR